MHAYWELGEDALQRWRQLLIDNKLKELPVERRRKNVRRKGIALSRQAIWYALVVCQVTTQQRSGPDSAAGRFLRSNSPALSIQICREAPSVQHLVEGECRGARLRRAPTIAKNLSSILQILEEGEWNVLERNLASLEVRTSLAKERSVANYLQSKKSAKSKTKKFPGLGPKQSRNFIQLLGLSRYEIPLDSRVLRRFAEFGSGFVPKGAALSDNVVYVFVQDGLQQIAKALNVYPCELDACIFASFHVSSDTEGDDDV